MNSSPALFAIFGLNVSNDKLALVLFAFLLATLLVIVLTPVAMKVAVRAGVLDHPHARRVHTKPTPRWGGLAMYAAFFLTVVILNFFDHTLLFDPQYGWDGFNPRVLGILFGGALITTLGAVDDKYSVPAKLKLLGQILAACVLVWPIFGVRLVNFGTDLNVVIFDADLNELFGTIFTIIWVVVVTNTVNLIDGLDGLAAGISGIAALTFVVIAVFLKGTLGEAMLAAAVAGVCLGFLRYNFNPARVFMGDAGSHFLGFTIAALSILQNWKVATGIAFAVPVLILAVPIFDTGFAIVRRMWRGQPIFGADKGHLHHRLLNMGLNQRQVVLTIYILTIVGSVLAYFLATARLWPEG